MSCSRRDSGQVSVGLYIYICIIQNYNLLQSENFVQLDVEEKGAEGKIFLRPEQKSKSRGIMTDVSHGLVTQIESRGRLVWQLACVELKPLLPAFQPACCLRGTQQTRHFGLTKSNKPPTRELIAHYILHDMHTYDRLLARAYIHTVRHTRTHNYDLT